MVKRIGEPIAVRRYRVQGEPDREIVLVIGKPIPPGTPEGDWSCPVLISGLGEDVFKFQEGVDALQTIQLAQTFARHELEASRLPIPWGNGEPGELGLYRPIHADFGLWLKRLVEGGYDLAIEAVGYVVVEVARRRDAKARTNLERSRAPRD